MKHKNYASKTIGFEVLNVSCGHGFIKEGKIMNETQNSFNNFIGIINKNKKVAAILLGLGFLAGAGTTIVLFNDPFGPQLYSLCKKAGFQRRCEPGNACDAGETLLASGLTLEQCKQRGGKE
ncbi:MAG: hypothetical protein ACRESZ_04660 [Methylococcales bacterium]